MALTQHTWQHLGLRAVAFCVGVDDRLGLAAAAAQVAVGQHVPDLYEDINNHGEDAHSASVVLGAVIMFAQLHNGASVVIVSKFLVRQWVSHIRTSAHYCLCSNKIHQIIIIKFINNYGGRFINNISHVTRECNAVKTRSIATTNVSHTRGMCSRVNLLRTGALCALASSGDWRSRKCTRLL